MSPARLPSIIPAPQNWRNMLVIIMLKLKVWFRPILVFEQPPGGLPVANQVTNRTSCWWVALIITGVIGVGGIIWLTRSPMVPQRRFHMHTEYAREAMIGVGGIIWLTRSPMVPQRRSHVHTQHVDLGEMA